MRILPAFAVSVLAAAALAVGLPVGALCENSASATTSTPAASSPARQATASATATQAATQTATQAATASTTTTPDKTVTVSVSPDDNGIVSVDGDLSVTVIVRNGTDAALSPGVIRLYLDKTSFTSRSTLEAWYARSPSDTTDALGAFMLSADVPAVPASSNTSAIRLTIPASTLPLTGSEWGAKAFGARYSVDGTPVAETHSSVVYAPKASYQPTKLGIAVPLTVPAATSGLLTSSQLATYTAPDGILTRELEAVRGHAVAIGIDPMILASIRILGTTAPPSASNWLLHLEHVPNQTFALAYGDADLSALRQAGANPLPKPIDFTTEIAAQLEAEPNSYTTPVATNPAETPAATAGAGAAAASSPAPTPSATTPPASSVPTTASLLSFPYTVENVAWPVSSTVATVDVPTFASSGVKTTILSSDNVKGDDGENAHARVAGETAIVSDDTLSGLLNDAATARSNAEWKTDVARLSAEVASMSYENPTDSRSLFATVDRGWAQNGSRLDETLTALTDLPWLRPVTLENVLAASATSTTLASREASDARVDALAPLVAADEDVQQFATALKQPDLVTSKERLRMLALSSIAWADDPSGLATEIAKLRASATSTTGQVKVVEGSNINILGDRSSLPIYVQNNTGSVAVVYLRVVPSNYNLSVEKNNLPITIQPKSQQRVTVPVQSLANGQVMITLTLTSSQGAAISTPSEVAINVQAGWETAITLVFAAAVVLLFGGGIYRSVRRRQRAKADRRAGAGSASGSAPDDTAGSETPRPDTGGTA